MPHRFQPMPPVAGTLVGGGVNIEAKGMSYKGFHKAYGWNNAESEMAAAASGASKYQTIPMAGLPAGTVQTAIGPE